MGGRGWQEGIGVGHRGGACGGERIMGASVHGSVRYTHMPEHALTSLSLTHLHTTAGCNCHTRAPSPSLTPTHMRTRPTMNTCAHLLPAAVTWVTTLRRGAASRTSCSLRRRSRWGDHRSFVGAICGWGDHRSFVGAISGWGDHRSFVGAICGWGDHRSFVWVPYVGGGTTGHLWVPYVGGGRRVRHYAVDDSMTIG